MSALIDWAFAHMEQLMNALLALMALTAAFGLGVSVDEWINERSRGDGQD